MEKEFKVFTDKTNRILLALLIGSVIVLIGVGVYIMNFHNAKYISKKEPLIMDCLELANYNIQESEYVTLHNFCVDDLSFEYQSDSKSSHVDYYYFFLNNMCYEGESPVIIMELDNGVYKKFANESDSLELVKNIYSGRIKKGVHTTARETDITKEIKSDNVYTFEAGMTPAKAKWQNVKGLGIVFLVGCVYFAILIYLIIYNYRNTKKNLQRRALEQNKTT